MKLYLNSCEPAEIREIARWGILDGVTMNPTMVAALNRDYVKNLQEICAIADMDVFAQVVAESAERMVEEAKALAAIHPRIIVKVQTNAEGVQAIRQLKQAGIRTCATAIHSTLEAIAVGRAGADHAAVFIGLLGEVDENPTEQLIATIREIYDQHAIETQLMAAVRSAAQLVQSLASGADEITAPYGVWKLFFQNGHTLARWNAFASNWKKAYGDRSWITGY
ncbi:MAG TPA: transaldolase family protein [Candidatus Baltobacteraceae bacterium]|nr:transaldolase family protein [Candidatus Baltobacteraceae bacterium]